MLKFSAWLACLTGVILALGVTAIYWGNLGTDLYYVVTTPLFTSAVYISATLLVWGGLASFRRLRHGPALLAAGWGFMWGMSFLMFEPINLNTLGDVVAPALSAIVERYLIGVAILMVIAMIGLASAILGTRRVV